MLSLRRSSEDVPLLVPFRRPDWSLLHATSRSPMSQHRKPLPHFPLHPPTPTSSTIPNSPTPPLLPVTQPPPIMHAIRHCNLIASHSTILRSAYPPFCSFTFTPPTDIASHAPLPLLPPPPFFWISSSLSLSPHHARPRTASLSPPPPPTTNPTRNHYALPTFAHRLDYQHPLHNQVHSMLRIARHTYLVVPPRHRHDSLLQRHHCAVTRRRLHSRQRER